MRTSTADSSELSAVRLAWRLLGSRPGFQFGFAGNAGVGSPGQLLHQFADLGRDRRASGSIRVRPPSPDQAPVPGQQRATLPAQ